MKRTLIISGITAILLFAGVYVYASIPGNSIGENKLDQYKKEALVNNPCRAVTPGREDYVSLCAQEDRQGVYYPGKAAYALLHSDNFFEGSKKVGKSQLKHLLTLLNDSASYAWGELGTPEVHYYFTFHDADDKCIGVNTIDLEGQAYSTPSINRMKWGLLKNMAPIDDIINHTEQK